MSWNKAYTNLVPTAIDTDGTIYQGTGYIEGYRSNSSGTISAQAKTVTTGFIPCKSTDVIRMAGVSWTLPSGYHYLSFYDSNFTLLGSTSIFPGTNSSTGYQHMARGNVALKGSSSVLPTIKNGVTTFDHYSFSSDASKVAYVRVNGYGSGANMKVTINEEIVGYSGTADLSIFPTMILDGIPIKKLELNGLLIWKAAINQISLSINSDGTIYNSIGYKDGYRVRSGGAEGAYSAASCSGFIKVNAGDIIRIAGCDFDIVDTSNAINVSDSTFTNIGQFTSQNANYGIFANTYSAYSYTSVVKEKNGVWKWVVPPAASGVAYIRVTGNTGGDGSSFLVTINEVL